MIILITNMMMINMNMRSNARDQEHVQLWFHDAPADSCKAIKFSAYTHTWSSSSSSTMMMMMIWLTMAPFSNACQHLCKAIAFSTYTPLMMMTMIIVMSWESGFMRIHFIFDFHLSDDNLQTNVQFANQGFPGCPETQITPEPRNPEMKTSDETGE